LPRKWGKVRGLWAGKGVFGQAEPSQNKLPLRYGPPFSRIIGRNGHFRAELSEPQMRVPDEYLKCVAFIGETYSSDPTGINGDLHATGFLVSTPCTRPELFGRQLIYFVTAKHVATDLAGRKVYFLANTTDGATASIPSASSSPFPGYGTWWLHPSDKTADVAVTQVGLAPRLDIKAIGVDRFATTERLKKFNVGLGDEVFFMGLFSPASNNERVTPIVRHGSLAMMPSEPISTELGLADVYLIEARSIGGISGSPVFVRPTVSIGLSPNEADLASSLGVGNVPTLLGLAHGHWDIKDWKLNNTLIEPVQKGGVNIGIAIVVPATKIYETLYQEELIQARQVIEKKICESDLPIPD
jgi:hypothetical protein